MRATDTVVVTIGPGDRRDVAGVGGHDRESAGPMERRVRHVDEDVTELRLGGVPVRIQGSQIVVAEPDDEWRPVLLSERERALFDVLVARPGIVHSKRSLLRAVWTTSALDEHLVEVTVGRLRQRLGAAGSGIETVVRRGYRVRSD